MPDWDNSMFNALQIKSAKRRSLDAGWSKKNQRSIINTWEKL
jgi:hypothetical protein